MTPESSTERARPWATSQGDALHSGSVGFDLGIRAPVIARVTQIEGQILSAPLIFENLAIFCGLKRNDAVRVFAVDLLSGVVLWNLALAGLPPCYWSCGVIEKESLVTFDAERVLRIDLRTGRLVAERDLGADFHVTSPAVESTASLQTTSPTRSH